MDFELLDLVPKKISYLEPQTKKQKIPELLRFRGAGGQETQEFCTATQHHARVLNVVAPQRDPPGSHRCPQCDLTCEGRMWMPVGSS